MADMLIGKTLNNRYQINDRIGIGGMAEVYSAQDTVLGRKVAVKVMLPQYAADAAFAQRFRQEAAAAANLQSPYIVNVYDWGQDDGIYYIVMEFVRGGDLKTAILQRGLIHQRKVAEIGSQVCQALSVAHNQDIIHRDIKPQNIMVQPDGNVKVMDFGIARAKNSMKEKTSAVLGTAHYISPEQAQGKELTPASDIYSLGIVLYEACTGRLPFDGPDAVNVAMQQVNDMPEPPSRFNPEISMDLEAIIMKALDKNPYARFATANDMRVALNNYLAGRPVGINAGSAATQVIGGAGETRVMNNVGQRGNDGTMMMPNVAQYGNNAGGQKSYNAGGNNPYQQGSDSSSTGKKIGIGVGIAVAVIAVVVIALFATGIIGGKGGKTVPSVTGMTVEAATKTLESQGFAIGTTSGKYDPSVAEGNIISQDPTAGSSKPEGTKVNVVVSQGAEQVTVPNLSGMTADQARQSLTALGLTANSADAQHSSEVEAGKVLSQKPAAGERVKKGDAVSYVLSLGPEDVTVPSVVGKSQSAATTTLQNAGFVVNVTTDYSSTVASGNVISQEPSGGKLEKGKTVTIVVSEGVQQVSVPNVYGMSVSNAKAALEAAGLSVKVSGDSGSDATVSAQSPDANAKVNAGSTVTITGKKASSNTAS